MVNKKITIRIRDYFKIFKKAIGHIGENRPVEHAGTTTYFAIFSMAPILIIIVSETVTLVLFMGLPVRL
jgi:membrane protein